MKYKIVFEKKAERQLRKIDKTQQRIIVNWLAKNIEDSSNPRIYGKALRGNLRNYWRYSLGNYRLIVEIDDFKVKVIVIEIGHRKDI